MSAEELLEQIKSEFKTRKFAAGLAMSFIDFLTGIGAAGSGLGSYKEFLTKFPRREATERGARANTLIVQLHDGSTKSIRGYYDRIQELIRSTHHRLDYPSAAPHSTQAWPDYVHWIGAMVAMPTATLAALRADILAFVLESLPSHELDDTALAKEPPVFLMLLREFSFRVQKGEPTGAAFQGAVFAFFRADAPHLQVEVRKVRTGSKRVGGIGDIDAWDGDRLVLSAEAKHTTFTARDAAALDGFANQISRRKAIGLVVTEAFEDGAAQAIEKKGLIPISRARMIELVVLWDPLKQRIASQAYLYYASHVEQNGPLTGRVRAFLKQIEAVPFQDDQMP